MGGGGSMAAANTTLKNNRNLLSKRKRLKNRLIGKEQDKYETKALSSSSYDLKRLKNRLKREHKEIRAKQLLIVGVVMLIIISVFIYYF